MRARVRERGRGTIVLLSATRVLLWLCPFSNLYSNKSGFLKRPEQQMIMSCAKKKKAMPWACTRDNRSMRIVSPRGSWAHRSLYRASFTSLLGRSPPGGLNYLRKVEIPTVSYRNKARPNIICSPPLYTAKYLIKKSHETNCCTHSKEEEKKTNCQNRAEPTLLVSTFFHLLLPWDICRKDCLVYYLSFSPFSRSMSFPERKDI